jgi:hypothetical protein
MTYFFMMSRHGREAGDGSRTHFMTRAPVLNV